MISSYLHPVLLLALVFAFLPISLVYADNFSRTKPLNSNWQRDQLQDEFPAVAMDNEGNCTAVWQRGRGNGVDFDVFASRSSDNGRTWSKKAVLNSTWDIEYTGIPIDGGYQNVMPTIATDGNGTWICAWLWNGPFRDPDTTEIYSNKVMFARSKDNGATWTCANALDSEYSTADVIYIPPCIASDGRDGWMCVWTAPYENAGEYYYGIFGALSQDDGKTWCDPVLIGSNGVDFVWWPRILADRNGNWLVAWLKDSATGMHIDYSVSINGTEWFPPKALTTNTERLYYEQFSIATDRNGKWMVVFAGFSDSGFLDVHECHSLDNAESWSALDPLTSSNYSARRGEREPSVATDGSGNWMVMWKEHNENTNRSRVVFRMCDGNLTEWGPITPTRERDKWITMLKSNTILTANHDGYWLAVWEWQCSQDGDIRTGRDIGYATMGPVTSQSEAILHTVE